MGARPRVIILLMMTAVLSATFGERAFGAGQNSTLLLSRPSGLGPLPAPGNINAVATRNAVSGDGRFVVFISTADDLGVVDTFPHVWVRDTEFDTTTLLDRAPGGGAPGNGNAAAVSISRDGSTACFLSEATNLVPGVTGSHVFVVTLSSGAIEVADRASGTGGSIGNDRPIGCALDAAGTRVVFDSLASNLVAGDTNSTIDVFLRDLGASSTERVSVSSVGVQAASGGSEGAISGDGLKVAFVATAPLVPGDTNGTGDVYVRNVQAGTLVRASVGTGGVESLGFSSEPAIDDTGGHVAFTSRANNLDLGGDTNNASDVFWRDLTGSDTTVLVSRASSGGAIGNGDSTSPAISGDGLGVAFQSAATNLLLVSPGPVRLVYLHRLGMNQTSLLSRATGLAGAPPDTEASNVSLGSTPSVATWQSSASNLDPEASGDFLAVFKRDLSVPLTPTTILVSRPTGTVPRSSGVNGSFVGSSQAISADGRIVVFGSAADGLDPAGASRRGQIFVRDAATNTTTLVSRDPTGVAANGECFNPAINAAGTHVTFVSQATNLVQDAIIGPNAGGTQIFVHELASGALQIASRADGADGDRSINVFGEPASISADGRRVAFTAGDSLVPADTNSHNDVYVRDLVAGTTTLASVAADGGAGDFPSFHATISADGTRVSFLSQATNLLEGDPVVGLHVFVRDLTAGTTVLADRTEEGTPGTGDAFLPQLSGTGTRVAFSTTQPLTADPISGNGAFYVRDIESGTTFLVSRADGANGAAAAPGSSISINHDGTRVAWHGFGAALPGGDAAHVYVRDLTANTTRLVSAADGTTDTLANGFSIGLAMSAGGGCVVFDNTADNLTTPAYPTRDFFQVYLRAVEGDCPVGAGTPTTTTSTTLPASSRTPIPANALVVKPGKFAKLVAKGLTLDPVDPRTNGGTLDLSGTTGSATYALPASGWKAIGRGEPKGFKFKRAGCRVSLLRKKVKAVCRGATGGLRLPEPGPVDVELTISGARALCAQCGGTAAGKATKVFKRKRCPAPSACP